MSVRHDSEPGQFGPQVGPSGGKPRDDMALVKCKDCGSDISTSAAGCLKCGGKPPKRTSLLAWLAMSCGVATVGTVISASIVGPSSASDAPTQAQVVAALQMAEISWHEGGFNNIMMLNAAVRNSGGRDVKDIKVVCNHSPNGETKSDSNSATIYGPFPAGKSKLIHEVDIGFFHAEAKGMSCSIVNATLATTRWGRSAG
jgi:hypothetical protein